MLTELLPTLDIPHLDIIASRQIIPISARNLMLSLDKLLKLVLLRKGIEISEYFPAAGIDA